MKFRLCMELLYHWSCCMP